MRDRSGYRSRISYEPSRPNVKDRYRTVGEWLFSPWVGVKDRVFSQPPKWISFGYALIVGALVAGCSPAPGGEPSADMACHFVPPPAKDLAGVDWELCGGDGGCVPCGHEGEPCCAGDVCDSLNNCVPPYGNGIGGCAPRAWSCVP